MMLQETRITVQGVRKITSSNGTFSCTVTSHGGTGFLLTTKAEITFKPISKRISILKTTMKKRKYRFISVYTQTNEFTVKDPEKTRSFYEQLSDIIANINRNVLIVIGGDSNAKTKMRNRIETLYSTRSLGNRQILTDINENGEKLMELCNLHNLQITYTFFKHKPTH